MLSLGDQNTIKIFLFSTPKLIFILRFFSTTGRQRILYFKVYNGYGNFIHFTEIANDWVHLTNKCFCHRKVSQSCVSLVSDYTTSIGHLFLQLFGMLHAFFECDFWQRNFANSNWIFFSILKGQWQCQWLWTHLFYHFISHVGSTCEHSIAC